MLVLHIVATLLLAASNIGAITMTIMARRISSPARILRLMKVHHVFAAQILVPAAVVTLGSGAWLTYTSHTSLIAPWMLGTLVLFVASALVGVLFLLPEEARATAEATRQVQAGETTASRELVRRTSSPAVVGAEWAEQIIMVAMFTLMIVQPS